MPGEVRNDTLIQNFGRNLAGAAAGYATSKLVNNEGSWNFESVATDAFGNALGNSIVRASQSSGTTTTGGGDKAGKATSQGAEQLVPAADNPNVLIGKAERPIDFSEFEYNQLTGEFGSQFPLELVSTEHLIAANNRILGVPNETEIAFSNYLNDSRNFVPAAEPGLGGVPVLPIEWAIDGVASIAQGLEDSVRDFGFFSTQTAKIGFGVAGEVALERTIGKLVPDNFFGNIGNRIGESFEFLADAFPSGSRSSFGQVNQVGAINFSDDPLINSYVQGLRSFNTPANTPANLFEIEQTGSLNFTVFGGGTSIDIDGFSGSTILEAKFIGNPGRSPFVENSDIPSFLKTKIQDQQRFEFERINAVLSDQSVPFNNLNVLINDQRGVPFFNSLITDFNIPGQVQVVPTNIKPFGK